MIRLAELRCEYRVNPLGVYTDEPRFSWKIQTDKNNVMQSAYTLQIANTENFDAGMLDSGWIESTESHLVLFKDTKFLSSAKYFWRVKVRDNYGEESQWSDTAFFETALLDKNEWKAVFISAEDENSSDSSAGTLLLKEITISKKIKNARLYASAKGIYEAYCGGRKIGDEILTPGFTEYGKRILFQTYDVTEYLKQGKNILFFMLGSGWYKGDLGWVNHRNHFGKQTAVIGQLKINYEDGEAEIIVTDDSWVCASAPVVYSEIYHGEIYDARLEVKDWSESGFTDNDFKKVFVESSDLSMLYPVDGLPVKEHEHFKAAAFFTTPKGDRVIDFGQNISGYVSFTVSGKPGDRVKLRHAETLDADGNFYTENLRGAKQSTEYILKGGCVECYKPHFTFQGFRYIAIDEFPSDIDPASFEAIAVYSAMKPAGSFKSSHELLNQFVNNVTWGMKDNFVDIPTDCPQRDERLGWTGDAQVFARSAGLIMETAPFFTKWLRCLSVSQYRNGKVPHVIPDALTKIEERNEAESDKAGSSAWADAAVIVPWTVYSYFADRRILEEQYPSMKKWVEYIRSTAENGLIFNSGFHYGDWVALDAKEGSYTGATPKDFCATAFYAHSAELLAKSADLLGKKDEALFYKELHSKITEAFGREFFTPTGRIASRTQTACILALRFGLCPSYAKERTLETYIKLLEENGNHLTTGFLGTPFACRVLADNGRLDLAYELLFKTDFPSWLYQITKGATTIWEHWDGIKPDGTMWSPNMNSLNHYAYGAVYDWVFTGIGGIDTEEGSGFKRIVLKPLFGAPLFWAESSYESPYGTIYLRWEKQEKGWKIDIKVPPNSGARFVLPGAKPEAVDSITGNAHFTETSEGAEVILGSGSYSFFVSDNGFLR